MQSMSPFSILNPSGVEGEVGVSELVLSRGLACFGSRQTGQNERA